MEEQPRPHEAKEDPVKQETQRLEARLDEVYCRVGKLVVELRSAEATARSLEEKKAEFQAGIEEIGALEERVRRDFLRREELEREIESIIRASRELETVLHSARHRHNELVGEVEQQRATNHTQEKQLSDARDQYTRLVEHNIAQLTKNDESRANNETLRARHAALVLQNSQDAAQCQAAEQQCALFRDRYAGIVQQQQQIGQAVRAPGPHVQIYGQATLREGDPEEPFAVLTTDGALLGTGITENGGIISYSPIVGDYATVEVRLGGQTQRVSTSPWIAPLSQAQPAAAPRPPAAVPAAAPPPQPEPPGSVYPVRTVAAAVAGD